jgi:hypothetical protein
MEVNAGVSPVLTPPARAIDAASPGRYNRPVAEVAASGSQAWRWAMLALNRDDGSITQHRVTTLVRRFAGWASRAKQRAKERCS